MTESIRTPRPEHPEGKTVEEMTDAERRARLARLDRERADSERALNEDRDRAAGDDVSPHYGGRAQPGDVLGIETGGETTGMGDTAEDENERRRRAEKNARE